MRAADHTDADSGRPNTAIWSIRGGVCSECSEPNALADVLRAHWQEAFSRNCHLIGKMRQRTVDTTSFFWLPVAVAVTSHTLPKV